MSLPTFETARNEICKLFNDFWAANTPAITTTAPKILWQGLENIDGTPPVDAPYCRFSMQHTDGRQTSLGPANGRRFERVGLILLSVYAPLSGKGIETSRRLGMVANAAFEGVGTASGIWFYDVSLRELGIDGNHFVHSVYANFRYQEIH